MTDTAGSAARPGGRHGNGAASGADGAGTSADAPSQAMRDGQAATQSAMSAGIDMVSQMTGSSISQARGAILPTDGEPAAGHAMAGLQAAMELNAMIVRSAQTLSREATEIAQQALQRNFDGLEALQRCRNMTDLMTLQSDLFRANVTGFFDGTRRLSQAMLRTLDQSSPSEAAAAASVRGDGGSTS